MAPKEKRKKVSVMAKILIGFVGGIVAGLVFGERVLIIEPIGTIFIKLLKMLVVPLVFSSLAVGMASMDDVKKMGRIGIQTLLLIIGTTLISVVLGIGLAFLISPGKGVQLDIIAMGEVTTKTTSFVSTIVNMVPDNPFGALARGDMLQIIVFAVFIGIAVILVGDKAKPLLNVLDGLAEVMYKITGIVIGFAPYGVFALISSVIGKQGPEVLLPLAKLIATVYLGVIIIILFTNGALTIGVLAKMNPLIFLKKVFPATLFSFVTSSSAGTLPVTMKCTDDMGVSRKISSFVLPLGATINMNGTSLYQGVCTIFVAQIAGVDLSITQLFVVVFTAILAAVGTAGVPGAGLVMLTMVLTSIGLPAEAIALVAGVDRLLDAARTSANVTGDAAISLVVAKWEKEFDAEKFNENKTA